MPNMDKAIEAAARALCRAEGNPENIKSEGKPMCRLRRLRSKPRCRICVTTELHAQVPLWHP